MFFFLNVSYNRSNILKVIGFQFNFLPDSSVSLKVLEGSYAPEISLWLQRKAISCLGNSECVSSGGLYMPVAVLGICAKLCSPAQKLNSDDELINKNLT